MLVITSFVICLAWLIWAATSSYWAEWAGAAESANGSMPVSTAVAGAWGDSFGAFNALAAALGFGAVAITLQLQYKSLEGQKVDQHILRFEDNFFRLIDLLRNLRDGLSYAQTSALSSSRPDINVQGLQNGHNAIEAAFLELQHFIFKVHCGRSIKHSIVAGTYDNYVHNRFEFCFAPYFRIIYTILYGVRCDHVLTDKQKAYYGNILRSQLTSFEIGLLAMNATSRYSKDLRDLIIYFRMLKYLPKKRRKVLGKIFPSVAYEARS